jgi:hypothetical protein
MASMVNLGKLLTILSLRKEKPSFDGRKHLAIYKYSKAC